ncbi:CopG family ribbon-helix-helix protein [Aquibium sp. LZ166]|uniref:CopG family ribbon-helix-helix protein n=1 Tax=Aquibium pacificus TaxID=3153579 RepID=A0ABV3SBJ6_9HYPH
MADSSSLVSVRLPDDLRQQVDDLARLTKRSRSFVVKEAVASYLEERRQYLDAIDEAVREADKGVFVSGTAVEAWLRSWGTGEPLPAPEPDILPHDEQ